MPAPLVRDADFDDIDTINSDAIRTRFGVYVRELHSYLNGLPALEGLQDARRRWRARARFDEAFGTFAVDPEHWYTFNHGGRNEMQFNIGMSPALLRIGMGFEFSLRRGGDPTLVQLTYASFVNIVREAPDDLLDLVQRNRLEVEWLPRGSAKLDYVETEDVLKFLEGPPYEPEWLFVGRVLRRTADRHILEDGSALDEIYSAVFGGLRPFWERTQVAI